MSEIKNLGEVIGEMIEASPDLRELFSGFVSPAYQYWEDGKKNRYFYTKEKIDHKGKARYVAGVYRYLKTKNQFKLVKSVGFAKKKKAIQWAHDKYTESKREGENHG